MRFKLLSGHDIQVEHVTFVTKLSTGPTLASFAVHFVSGDKIYVRGPTEAATSDRARLVKAMSERD